MSLLKEFKESIITVNAGNFKESALSLFRYQAMKNIVYQKFIKSLSVDPFKVTDLVSIPFLPIDFFKTKSIRSGDWEPEGVFKSSGTTMSTRSIHEVEDERFYLYNTKLIFERIYGPLLNWTFFALLPSYQEQGFSSLIKMVDFFMKESGGVGGYYLDEFLLLERELKKCVENGRKVILFGVGYALLDMVAFLGVSDFDWSQITIIETGGMKGRRKDMVKDEFYSELRSCFANVNVNSEYGMTELLSQAYATEDNKFIMPNQMKVLIRDVNDPFCILENGQSGGVNVIDLANIHSCAFLETKDLGRITGPKTFEILGRFDNSDVRGCNLMVV